MTATSARRRRQARNRAAAVMEGGSQQGTERPRKQPAFQFKRRSKTNFRGLVLAVAAGYFFQKTFRDQLLPHGLPAMEAPILRVPVPKGKSWYASINRTNDSLQLVHGQTHKILERNDDKHSLIQGPETVVIHKDGSLFILSETGHLVELLDLDKKDPIQWTAKAVIVKNLGVGRPLGGRFTPDGKTLYVADAVLGLTRLANFRNPKSHVELVASTVPVQDENGTVTTLPLRYVNSVAIGPKTGKVYFTDSTDISSDRLNTRRHKKGPLEHEWDTMYASKMDLIRNIPRGRLCEYNPATDQVRVLANDIHFANGVAVDPVDESFLVVAETFGTNLLKFPLHHKHTEDQVRNDLLQVLVASHDMVGYIDNVDCGVVHGKVRCFAAVISPFVPLHKLLVHLPDTIQYLIRILILTIPRRLAPPVQKYGGILVVNPASGDFDYIQDPTGKDIRSIAGVTVHSNKLYLGSLVNNYVGVYDLIE